MRIVDCGKEEGIQKNACLLSGAKDFSEESRLPALARKTPRSQPGSSLENERQSMNPQFPLFTRALLSSHPRGMKLRNQLLALFCLLAFIGIGVLYFHVWVVQKPFGIILVIGNGLVPEQLTAARIYEGSARHRLALEQLPHTAMLATYSNDFAVPDAPAAASAIATGVKVNNRSIAINPRDQPLSSIIDEARRAGRAIGVVTNGRLTDPGIAAFYAHAANGAETDQIAAQFVDEGKLNVAFGGGAHDFTPQAKGGVRKDGRDLLLEMRQKNLDLIRSRAELEDSATFRTKPLIGIFGNGPLGYSNQVDPQQPTLSDMVRRAIEILQFNTGGYLLIVDAELISRAAEQNDGEHVLTETIDMDHALGIAMRYAGDNTLVIATATHGIGGMTLNGYPLQPDRGVSLIGKNPFGYPSITWASGPNGRPPTPIVPGPAADVSPPPENANSENSPAAFYAPSAISHATDVIAVGAGPGSEELHGFLDNTVIFQIIKKQL